MDEKSLKDLHAEAAILLSSLSKEGLCDEIEDAKYRLSALLENVADLSESWTLLHICDVQAGMYADVEALAHRLVVYHLALSQYYKKLYGC